MENRRSHVRLNSLAVFEAVARHQHVTRAAAELAISQPAVSRHLKNLESQIGIRLFERTSKKLNLTSAGRTLAANVRAGLDSIHETIFVLQKQQTNRQVLIGCSHEIAYGWLTPRFAALRAAFDHLQIRILTSDHYADFDAGDVDISIRYASTAKPRPHSRVLMQEEIIPIASPILIERAGLNDVLGPEAVFLELEPEIAEFATWDFWFERRKSHAPATRRTQTFSSYMLLLECAIAGQGVALGWRGLIEQHVERETLVPLIPDYVQTGGHFALITRPKPDDHVRQIVDWFVRSVRGTK
jgi:DNA-binding transcriptional LysR family regulator